MHRFLEIKTRVIGGAASWDFLTNHAHVLVCVANDPAIRLRDIAAAVGITERSAHQILSQLVEEGPASARGDGNRYQVVRATDAPSPPPGTRGGRVARGPGRLDDEERSDMTLEV